jgi:glycosyltransferase involved in cell wall biosynthesis
MISYSIVISVYNQRETLRQALDALRRQIKNLKVFEVIVVDDGSSDGTGELVRKLRYPIFLKYLPSGVNKGRPHNRNRGLEKAAGEWVIFIDGDMVPGEGFIESYMKAWKEFPNGVLVGSWRFPASREASKWDRYFESRGRLAMKSGQELRGKYFTSDNFSIRRETLTRLQGFDTSFEGWGGEDTEFGLRLEKNHFQIFNVREAFCYHFQAKTLDDILKEYERFGRFGYPLLLKKFPNEDIYDMGWLLGLQSHDMGLHRTVLSALLHPLRSTLSLALLRALARIGRGVLFNDTMYDLLLYGHVARGFRKR